MCSSGRDSAANIQLLLLALSDLKSERISRLEIIIDLMMTRWIRISDAQSSPVVMAVVYAATT